MPYKPPLKNYTLHSGELTQVQFLLLKHWLPPKSTLELLELAEEP